jgi:hypothetical protein
VVLASLFPVLIDGIHVLSWGPLSEMFVTLLMTPSGLSGALVLGLYVLYVGSLICLQFLKPTVALETVVIESQDEVTGEWTETHTNWPTMLFFYPSLGFGIVMIYAMVMAMMPPDRQFTVSDGVGSAMATAGALLFIVHCVVVSGAITPKKRWGPTDRAHFGLLIPIVLIGELVLNFSNALLITTFGPDGVTPPIEDPSFAWSFVIMAPLYLVFFAAPRFTFMSKTFTWPSFASGFAFALYTVWTFVKEHPVL